MNSRKAEILALADRTAKLPIADLSAHGVVVLAVAELLRSGPPDLAQDIKDFHVKFGLEYTGKPRELEPEMSKFRFKFMQEELDEYFSSIQSGDLEGQLDALVDLVYVAIGTAYLHGFDFNEAWTRVHEANMKKVRAESKRQSKRGTQFDIVKPAGWTPPCLKDLVE